MKPALGCHLEPNYSAITPTNLPKPTWQPTQMEVLHRLVQHVHDSRRGPSLSLKCHFGHIALSSLKQDVFPNWRGAPKGAVLCQPCHAHLQADIRRCPSVAPAPQKKRRLGPCALGHTTSSFNRKGLEIWFALPQGACFRDLQPGSTLCWGCYRQFTRERTSTPHAGLRRVTQGASRSKRSIVLANSAGTADSAITVPSTKRRRGDPPARYPPPLTPEPQHPTERPISHLSTHQTRPSGSPPPPKRHRTFVYPSRAQAKSSSLTFRGVKASISLSSVPPSRPLHEPPSLLHQAATARPPGHP